MKKIIRLTESDLVRLVKRVINEQSTPSIFDECFTTQGIPLDKLPQFCKDMMTNKDEVNPFYVRCASELMKGEFYKTTDMMDKVDAAIQCVHEKLVDENTGYRKVVYK